MDSVPKSSAPETVSGPQRSPGGNRLLLELGARARALRERRGMTRRTLAAAAGVSERHLANLEYGAGNVSVRVLDQVAAALHCSPAELIDDATRRSPEWLLLRALLQDCSEATLRRVRERVAHLLEGVPRALPDGRKIALIGLRGAGKTTLGEMLAGHLGRDFVELSRVIETVAGCSIGEIQALYGASAFRRYQQRALERVIDDCAHAVLAVPGGLVTDPVAFDRLLTSCHTLWLQATPEDHMRRVVAQGDLRPIEGNREAMKDLKYILATREPYYAEAHDRLDTSAQPLEQTFERLCELTRKLEHTAANSFCINPDTTQEARS